MFIVFMLNFTLLLPLICSVFICYCCFRYILFISSRNYQFILEGKFSYRRLKISYNQRIILLPLPHCTNGCRLTSSSATLHNWSKHWWPRSLKVAICSFHHNFCSSTLSIDRSQRTTEHGVCNLWQSLSCFFAFSPGWLSSWWALIDSNTILFHYYFFVRHLS